MRHKITQKPYYYECGDGCCTEWGTTWAVDGKEVYTGPDDDHGMLAVLTELGISAEIAHLGEEDGEEVCSVDNFNETNETNEKL